MEEEVSTPWIGQQALARSLQCSRQHLDNLVKAGKLKRYYLGTRAYYLIEEVVSAFEMKSDEKR